MPRASVTSKMASISFMVTTSSMGGLFSLGCDQDLHDRTTGEGVFHALLEALEGHTPADQRRHVHRATGDQADGLLPVLTRIETRPVHRQLAGEHLVEIH